jgi:hypothetical protein
MGIPLTLKLVLPLLAVTAHDFKVETPAPVLLAIGAVGMGLVGKAARRGRPR